MIQSLLTPASVHRVTNEVNVYMLAEYIYTNLWIFVPGVNLVFYTFAERTKDLYLYYYMLVNEVVRWANFLRTE